MTKAKKWCGCGIPVCYADHEAWDWEPPQNEVAPEGQKEGE